MPASQILFQTGFSWTLKAITDQRCAFRVDDSTWEKVEVILFAIHYHCVSCIVSTLLMKQEFSLNHTFRFFFRIKNEVDKTTSEPPDTFTREAAVRHSSLKLLFFSSIYFLNRTWLPLVCPRLRFGLLTYQAPQRMWPLTSPAGGGGALWPPDHKVLGRQYNAATVGRVSQGCPGGGISVIWPQGCVPVGYARRQNLTCLELVLLFFDLGNAYKSNLPMSSWITQRNFTF